MTAACPKCASVDARSIAMIYRERRRPQIDLLRRAAPPRKRNGTVWFLLTLVLTVGFFLELSSFGVGAVVLGGLALSGGWMTRQIRAYNATDLPDLVKRWERSAMCNRCGHVFVQSD